MDDAELTALPSELRFQLWDTFTAGVTYARGARKLKAMIDLKAAAHRAAGTPGVPL